MTAPAIGARTAGGPPGPPLLGSTKSPPFRLPGEHFAAALVFLAAGAAGVVVVAPELAVGAYPSPRVIGVTHLFTLGWLTTSILGALYQFMPVALGQSVRSEGLAHASFVLHVTGLPVFVGGLLTGRADATIGGASTVAAGLALFLVNLGATLTNGKRRDVTWWCLLGAGACLTATLALGMALAGNLQTGFLGEARFIALGVHLHVALGGWVLLVVVGVAQRLLPMFLLSHGVGEGPTRAAAVLIGGGAGTLVLFHHAPPLLARWLPGLLLGGGLACFLAQALRFYRRRVKRSLDPGMRLAAWALVLMAGGLALAGPVIAGIATPGMSTAYVAVLVGAFTLFVVAHYYKILPFLVWYHHFGPVAGRQPVPKVSELYHKGVADVVGALLPLGVVAISTGVLLGSALTVGLAGVSLLVGVGLAAVQMALVARRRPA